MADEPIYLDYSRIDEIRKGISNILGDSYQENGFEDGSGRINISKNEEVIACIQVNSADKIAYMVVNNYKVLPKNDVHTKTIDYIINYFEK